MSQSSIYWLWHNYAVIARASVLREPYLDGDHFNTDWDLQQQAMLTASLAFACALFEAIGKKKSTPHNRVLVHLRNALLHNAGNITKNIGAPEPENTCRAYITSAQWTELDPRDSEGEPLTDSDGQTVKAQRQFFAISSDGQVRLAPSILRFVGVLLHTQHET